MPLRAGCEDRSGGETGSEAGHGPLDTAHLDRQTFGDRKLRGEVLGMFLQQIEALGERLREAGPEERRELAHALRGAARGVGAFALAERAAALEAVPEDAGRIAPLVRAAEAVRAFIAQLR